MKSIEIGDTKIGPSEPPFIIAEMSANHNGSIENAFKIIDKAKECGASAVKMQTYTADTITLKSDSDDFKIKGGLWDGKTLYDLYEEAHTPWHWHKELFDYAKEKQIIIFSSPFDETAIELLEELGSPAYKIASFELVDHQLIAKAAQTGKPLIMSTGMANHSEISEAVTCAKSNGCNQLALLHCVSGYPAKSEEYNLMTLKDLQDSFDCIVGLSDHTLNNITAFTSIPFGASIIEKHFTLDRKGGGPDDSFSLEPEGLFDLVQGSMSSWLSIGRVNYEPTKGEKENIKFRRSLYVIQDLKAGDEITSNVIQSIRPGYGLSPKFYSQIMGKKVTQDIQAPHPLSFDDLES